MCLCIHACVFTPVSQYLCPNTCAYIRVLFVFSISVELLLLVLHNHINHLRGNIFYSDDGDAESVCDK